MKNDAKQDSCEQITFSDIFSSMNIMTDDTCIDLPLDWGEAFDPASGSQAQPAPAAGRRRSAVAGPDRARRRSAGSISDALIFSLADLGRVDIEYMADISGETPDSVISALRGSIFQAPLKWDEDPYKGWETAEEYLSGNLMRKLKEAREAGRQHGGRFAGNIRAIEKVLPPAASADDIYITLGSPWVPGRCDRRLHAPSVRRSSQALEQQLQRTHYGILAGQDTMNSPAHGRSPKNPGTTTAWPFAGRTYGTEKMEALHILEKTLNMKTVKVTTEIKAEGNSSGKKRVIDKEETAAALEKQRRLIGEFRRWVWADPAGKSASKRYSRTDTAASGRGILTALSSSFRGCRRKSAFTPIRKMRSPASSFRPIRSLLTMWDPERLM